MLIKGTPCFPTGLSKVKNCYKHLYNFQIATGNTAPLNNFYMSLIGVHEKNSCFPQFVHYKARQCILNLSNRPELTALKCPKDQIFSSSDTNNFTTKQSLHTKKTFKSLFPTFPDYSLQQNFAYCETGDFNKCTDSTLTLPTYTL